MKRTINASVVRAIIRAYEDGVTSQAISQLFKVSQHDIINIMYAYKIGKTKKERKWSLKNS